MRKDAKKILKITFLSLLFLFIVVFAFFRSKDLILGVKIKNINIFDGEKVMDSILKINGNAKNAKTLTLNGRSILIDQKGNFDETIVLFSGYNVINIKAQDKFGHIDEKNYKIMH
jgi:hypothetical protein